MSSCPMLLTETVNMCGVRAVSRLRGLFHSKLLFQIFCLVVFVLLFTLFVLFMAFSSFMK